jgi:hypothetical protein
MVNMFEQQLADSVFVASDRAYHDAVEYYNAVKEAARQRVTGAEAAYDALKDYFKRAKHASTEPTDAEIERDVRSLLHGTKDGRVVIENERPTVSEGERKVIDEVHSEHADFKEDLEAKAKE